MPTRRLWSLLLFPAGMLVGHQIGYWATAQAGTAPSLTGGHDYLTNLAALAVPFTVAVIARAFVAGRRGEVVPIRALVLVGQQVLLFVGVEILEHALVGIDPMRSMTELSFLLGALAQVAVALLFYAFLRLVSRVGAAVGASRSERPLAARSSRPRPPRAIARWDLVTGFGSISLRGPPSLLLS